jgi:hypothetical protein
MKNIHPLEVRPMLGSAPGSPTSLKTKFIGSGSAETFRPSGPVTNVPSGIEGSSELRFTVSVVLIFGSDFKIIICAIIRKFYFIANNI